MGVLRRVALFGDYWSIPAVKESATVSQYGVSATTRSSSKLQGFEGGVHLHLGDTDAPVVPYVLGSVGWGHQSWEETVVVGTGASRRTYTEKESDTGLQVGGGLGARLYLGKNWGVQPEFSVNRALDTEPGCPAVTIVRAQVGVFYQFGK